MDKNKITKEEELINLLKYKYNLNYLDAILFKINNCIDDNLDSNDILLYMFFKNSNETQIQMNNFIKKLNLKSSLETYFDTIYNKYNIYNTIILNIHNIKILFSKLYGKKPFLKEIKKFKIIIAKNILIKTPRCIIRPCNPRDYQDLIPVWTDEDNIKQHGYVWTKSDISYIVNISPLKKYYNNFCRESNNLKENEVIFSVEIKEQINDIKFDKVIGCIAIQKLNDEFIYYLKKNNEEPDLSCSVSVGYSFNKYYHGMGYASEILCEICNFLFENMKNLNNNVIYANVIQSNISSQKVLEKNNFQKIGFSLIESLNDVVIYYKCNLIERGIIDSKKFIKRYV